MVVWKELPRTDLYGRPSHGTFCSSDVGDNPHRMLTRTRVELRGCHMQDIRPRIPVPTSWLEESRTSKCSSDSDSDSISAPAACGDWIPYMYPHVELLDAFQYIVTGTQQAVDDLDSHSYDQKSLALPKWASVATHRLLSLRPSDKTTHDGIEGLADFFAEAFRLAMLLFMAPIWRYYGVCTVFTQIMVQKLHETLRIRLSGVHWGKRLATLQLWILCMGAFEANIVQDEKAERYFVEAFVEASVLSPDPIGGVRRLLWVPKLFDAQEAALQRDVDILWRERYSTSRSVR